MTTYQKNVFGVEFQQVRPVGLEAQAQAYGDMAQVTANVAKSALELGEREYVSTLQKQAQDQLRAAYEENPASPDTLQKLYKEMESKLVGGSTIFPHLQKRGSEVFRRMSEPYLNRSRDNFTVQQVENDRVVTTQNIELGMNEITENAALAYRADGAIDMNAFDRIAQATETMEQELSRIGVNGRPLFSASQRVAYMAEGVERTAQSAIDGMLDNGRSASSLLKNWKENGIEYDVDGVRVSLKEAVTAEGRDRITRNLEVRAEEELRAYEKRVKEAAAQQEKKNQMQMGLMFQTGGALFNPEIKEHKKALDTYLKDFLVPSISGADPAQRNEILAETIKNVGYMPDLLKGHIRSVARSNSPELMTQAADLIQRVRAQGADHVLLDIPDRDLSRISVVVDQLNTGAPISEAMDYLKQTHSDFNKGLMDTRRKELADIEIDPFVESQDIGLLDWIPFVNPDSDDVKMESERELLFNQPAIEDLNRQGKAIFEKHYLLTGNEELAKETMKGYLKAKFSVTEVNGFAQPMEYAPSVHVNMPYVDNVDKIIREQVLEDAKKIIGDSITGLDPDTIIIAPDPFVTPRTFQEGKPRYNIFQIMPNGLPERLTNNPVYGTEQQFFTVDKGAIFDIHRKKAEKRMNSGVLPEFTNPLSSENMKLFTGGE